MKITKARRRWLWIGGASVGVLIGTATWMFLAASAQLGLIAPYGKLKSRLAVLAWTWLDETEEFDRERLLRFYRAHLDRGPEDVP